MSKYTKYMNTIQSDWSTNNPDNIIGKLNTILKAINFTPDFYN